MSAKSKLKRRCSRQRKDYQKRLSNAYWTWLGSMLRKNPPRRPQMLRKGKLHKRFVNVVLPMIEKARARAAAERTSP